MFNDTLLPSSAAPAASSGQQAAPALPRSHTPRRERAREPGYCCGRDSFRNGKPGIRG